MNVAAGSFFENRALVDRMQSPGKFFNQPTHRIVGAIGCVLALVVEQSPGVMR